ncbi:MAG: hypothetical protein ACHQYP_11635 [Nitrospiria bacterium]
MLNLIHPGGKGIYRPLNLILVLIIAGFSILLVNIWRNLPEVPTLAIKPIGRASSGSQAREILSASAYQMMVDNDVFRPSRQKYVPIPKPKAKPKSQLALPAPPPPKPVPKLALIGTVLLDDGEAAIIENMGSGRKTANYKLGDNIEGFIVKEIQKEMVLLDRDGESLKVIMNQSAVTEPNQPVPMKPPQTNTPPVGAPGTPFIPPYQKGHPGGLK